MRIYKSNDPDIHIPTDLNLTELLHTSARSPPFSSDHLIALDNLQTRSLALGQLRSTAGRLAAGLAHSFRPPDQARWALILPNSVTYVEAVHAVLWSGGVWCPINHQLKAGEIAHALRVSRPDFVIAYSEVVGKVDESVKIARQKSPDWRHPKVLTAIGSPAKGYPDLYADFLATESLPIPHYADTRKRLASIHLSSGTTGNPKGVGISHFNYVANVYQMFAHDPDQWSPKEKVVAFTPFVHIANTTLPLFLGPWTGTAHVIMASFEIEAYAKLIQQTKATSAQISPATAVAIATTDLVERYNFSSITRFICIPIPLKEDMYRTFLSQGRWKTVTLYGMTEAAPYVAWKAMGDSMPASKSGTILPNILASLRLEHGEDAPEGGPGELWLKGPNLVAGYVDNPTANQVAFDGEGWYNTGDVCTISPEGHLQVVGRTKELIKYNGFQVSPTELEAYIFSHPDIEDSAVGGVYDRTKMTELPTAYVVFKSHLTDRDQKIQALKDLQTRVDRQVSGYKKLRGGVWEVTMVPRNATLKVLRKQLGTYKTGLCSLDNEKESAKL
ncbi:uncharacterized protein Z518_10269 [Rhinocladiella mackenziei CBS 650.93]|uniref:Rhinocladiella mackenziei CBS 650.93 unplaced genomic scaffold supercont1.9, whole genome shotgun sequence n=1 Tax=Rhinocladiella mackenziei CBS 650.93 TaxID=1442369 RepID=A0A0D2FDH1_9EURO|nr:uncharacterized protein Z518_10269 [Rhinocladiella mackenziei CBS 650.93]KIX00132.1 hypothetical protein Z518_10269 [Rhinocladiella mackenziei CBS 650.93]